MFKRFYLGEPSAIRTRDTLLKREDVSSSGNVVSTLEAVLWCLLTTNSYTECVLKAVNLGGDTDTIGMVTGGLAGIMYGLDGIPKGWVETTIGEETEVRRGGSPRPIQEYLSDEGLNWLKISDATASNSPFIYQIKEKIKSEGLKKTVFMKAGAIILSNSATPGIPKILKIDTCIHDGWLYFPDLQLSNEYMYHLFLQI